MYNIPWCESTSYLDRHEVLCISSQVSLNFAHFFIVSYPKRIVLGSRPNASDLCCCIVFELIALETFSMQKLSGLRIRLFCCIVFELLSLGEIPMQMLSGFVFGFVAFA